MLKLQWDPSPLYFISTDIVAREAWFVKRELRDTLHVSRFTSRITCDSRPDQRELEHWAADAKQSP
jgi:hypothetical protein